MSFFKDLKDDAAEALDELAGKDEVNPGDDALIQSPDVNMTGDEILDDEILDDEIVDDEIVDDEIVDDDEVMEGAEEVGDEDLLDDMLVEDYLNGDGTDEDESGDIEYDEDETLADGGTADRTADVNQVTIITKGTTINGSIISDCSLDVMGVINGDIECLGKLSISGNVVGNSVASEVFVSAKRLEGNIDSEGSVKIGLGTVVVGDVKAGSGVIAGAVKGELDIQGPVIIDSTAIIKGNIKARTVQMNNGAVVEGFCSLSYSTVNIDDIFE